MSGWSSYKKEQRQFNDWRSFLKEEFYAAGITSQEMPDSLHNMLKPLMSQGLTQQQGNALIRLFFELAKEENVLLEVSLGDTGANRTFSGEATGKIGELITSFGLKSDLSKKLVQTINKWATINQVKLEKPSSPAPAAAPAAATPAATPGEKPPVPAFLRAEPEATATAEPPDRRTADVEAEEDFENWDFDDAAVDTSADDDDSADDDIESEEDFASWDFYDPYSGEDTEPAKEDGSTDDVEAEEDFGNWDFYDPFSDDDFPSEPGGVDSAPLDAALAANKAAAAKRKKAAEDAAANAAAKKSRIEREKRAAEEEARQRFRARKSLEEDIDEKSRT